MWWNSDSKQSHTHMLGRSRTQKSVPMHYAGFYLNTFLQPVKQWYHETWSAGLLWLVIVPMKTFFLRMIVACGFLTFDFEVILSIKVTLNHDMGLLWSTFYAHLQARTISILKTNSKKLQNKNINALYTEMQGYYSKFK